jgi:hypothetical protein
LADRIEPSFTHGVIMGDVVQSRSVESVRRLFEIFNTTIEIANRNHTRHLASPLTITLGDEFQGLSRSLADGAAIIREIRRELLRAQVKCRFVLGLVKVETPINTERAWNMMGPGLAEARKKLADKRDQNAYRFSLPHDPMIESLLNAIGAAQTDVESAWTKRQAEIVEASWDTDAPDAELAARQGLQVRTLYKIRRAARYDLYRLQWKTLSSTLVDLDRRYNLMQ